MDTNLRIRELCKSKGVTVQGLEKELGFSNASIAKANSNMKAEKLKAIADYFGVTMEYLMTGQTQSEAATPHPLTDQERELLKRFVLLDQGDRGKLPAYLDALLAAENTIKKNSSRDLFIICSQIYDKIHSVDCPLQLEYSGCVCLTSASNGMS